MHSKLGILAAMAILTLTLDGRAALIHWAGWTSSAAGGAGSVEGSLTLNGAPVGVHYTGEVFAAQVNNLGTYYYLSPIPSLPSYVSAAVDNGPATADIIEIRGGSGSWNTVFFDAPVVDPVMAIVGLGEVDLPASYLFDAPFTVLGSGYGFFGMGSMPLTAAGGNVLTAKEAHGVIQFQGTYSSISFTATKSRDWSGFTIGAADAVAAVPEPDSLMLAMLGLALLAITGRRRLATILALMGIALLALTRGRRMSRKALSP
jgi:hypothetical protein